MLSGLKTAIMMQQSHHVCHLLQQQRHVLQHWGLHWSLSLQHLVCAAVLALIALHGSRSSSAAQLNSLALSTHCRWG